MIKILFVCHGNICRSPMAEFVMKDIVHRNGCDDQFLIDSKATSTEELGNPPHHGTVKKLQEEGILLGSHRAEQMTWRDYDNYDLLIGMDDWNLKNMLRILGNDDPKQRVCLLLDFTGKHRSIADPWYSGDFDATYDDVKEGCEALFAYLVENGWVEQ